MVRDLAQACREQYGRRAGITLWALAEVAIAATDLAEVLGSAVALQLLFGLPLLVGVVITVADVLIGAATEAQRLPLRRSDRGRVGRRDRPEFCRRALPLASGWRGHAGGIRAVT